MGAFGENWLSAVEALQHEWIVKTNGVEIENVGPVNDKVKRKEYDQDCDSGVSGNQEKRTRSKTVIVVI